MVMGVKGRSCVSYTTMLLGDRPNPAFDKKKRYKSLHKVNEIH